MYFFYSVKNTCWNRQGIFSIANKLKLPSTALGRTTPFSPTIRVGQHYTLQSSFLTSWLIDFYNRRSTKNIPLYVFALFKGLCLYMLRGCTFSACRHRQLVIVARHFLSTSIIAALFIMPHCLEYLPKTYKFCCYFFSWSFVYLRLSYLSFFTERKKDYQAEYKG